MSAISRSAPPSERGDGRRIGNRPVDRSGKVLTQRKESRFRAARTSLLAHGEPMVWLTSGALAVALVMIVGLVGLVLAQGLGTFWPTPVLEIQTRDGKRVLGEVARVEEKSAPEAGEENPESRRLLRSGNFELTGTHFEWIEAGNVVKEERPPWAVAVERTAWGRFFGTPRAFRRDGAELAAGPAEAWEEFARHHPVVLERSDQARRLKIETIGSINRRLERARLAVRRAELGSRGTDGESEAVRAARAELERIQGETAAAFQAALVEIEKLERENERYELVMVTADGTEKALPLAEIVRAYPANQLSSLGRWSVYGSRWWEFLTGPPRAANSEGGIFPAIWGTVAMTLIMTVAVVPCGVLAALYLREYARAGLLVSIVRIAVNNLAGVPSIVFGVFGLGFFCYIVGHSIDETFFSASLPDPTFGKGGLLWASLTLALLTLPVVIVATEEALAAVPSSMREGSYACGASKWQTIHRIVLPRAMPGIMTGMMLAVARGAGEVAPLMLVGAVKLAPHLPVDSVFPYVHLDRSFMHLGFQIYDSGFQSQNSEAAKPLVFTITLVLIVIVATLGLAGVWVRQRFQRRYLGSKF